MRRINILLAHRQISVFMQHADVFDDGKFIAMPLLEATVVDEWGDGHLQALIKQCENTPYILVAVFGEKVYYRNPQVQVISDGSNWMTLDNFLRSVSC